MNNLAPMKNCPGGCKVTYIGCQGKSDMSSYTSGTVIDYRQSSTRRLPIQRQHKLPHHQIKAKQDISIHDWSLKYLKGVKDVHSTILV